jgi:hypothetical protein
MPEAGRRRVDGYYLDSSGGLKRVTGGAKARVAMGRKTEIGQREVRRVLFSRLDARGTRALKVKRRLGRRQGDDDCQDDGADLDDP